MGVSSPAVLKEKESSFGEEPGDGWSDEESVAVNESDENESFDPYDATKVIHRRIGVWDFYEAKQPKFKITNFLGFDHLEKLRKGIPHAVRLAEEIDSIPSCRKYLLLYGATTLFSGAVLPALQLWSNAKHLEFTQELLQGRPVEVQLILGSLLAHISSQVLSSVVGYISGRFRYKLQALIQRHFELKAMRILMSLDLVTFQDSGVQNKLQILRNSASWSTLPDLIHSMAQLGSVISSGMVFGYVYLSQKRTPASLVNVALSSIPTVLSFMQVWRGFLPHTTWAATCRDENYIRMEGLKSLAESTAARQEIVAGNLQTHILSEWEISSSKVVGMAESLETAFETEAESKIALFDTFISPSMWYLPEIYFFVSALYNPEDMVQSFASMQVMRQVTSNISWRVASIPRDLRNFVRILEGIEKLYEAGTIKNKIVDGTESYALGDGASGLSIEFKDVTFKYPNSEKVALEKVSFTVAKGGMCVIVGTNGSGKSTLLKLLLRIYDPDEGEILIDGRDIKSLKLSDLRNTIATLFQTFSSFPLSISEDIGMGDPQHSQNRKQITQAADLGGATDVIEKLSDKFDTFLSPPVQDQYCMLPKGTKKLFGNNKLTDPESNYGYSSTSHSLSGGEFQRLALSRTFMRTMNENMPIGLLLFDEPSAALDPEAEYALFERMIELRGQRTMIFSSHRFGKLTKHADTILYMKDSKVLEAGTHEELLAKDGGYASMYKVQAEAFTEGPSPRSKSGAATPSEDSMELI